MKYFLYPLVLFSFFVTTTFAGTYNKIAFYVVAHQDDWQLFMGDRVFSDATDTNTKVVIIHTTAGDATCGHPLNIQYYRARESGAINSLEFCADVHSIHRRSKIDTVTANGHRVRKFSNKNIVNYFMLLPDGCTKCGWNGQSLEYLNKGDINNLLTVDSTNLYNNWDEIVNTLKDVFVNESLTIPDITLNVADLDSNINPGDHPDHLFSSLVALQAIKDLGPVTTNLFIGYHTANMPPNLATSSIVLKGALFALADFGITQNNITTTWFNHQDFLNRTYFRTITGSTDSIVQAFLKMPVVQHADVYPNPAHGFCHINYNIVQECNVDIKIFDAGGTMIRYVMNEHKISGYHTNKIDLSNLQSGTYYVIIKTKNYQTSIPLVVF